jgi:hypothetical protein
MCSVPPPFHSRIAARAARPILQAAADRGQAVALRIGLLQLPEQDLGLSAAQIHRRRRAGPEAAATRTTAEA